MCNLILSTPGINETTKKLITQSYFKNDRSVHLFYPNRERCNCYRIPSIYSLPDNYLIALCEGRRDHCGDTGNINLTYKLSADNGFIWTFEEFTVKSIVNFLKNPDKTLTIGKPTLVYEKTHQRLYFFFFVLIL